MAITFAYTESTNRVVVTEGTEGAPATFADFVTADRAGTDTDLLVAGSPASDLALTYAVRPVEDLALKVKCIVANKTAEADFIFITGKDWRGAAQTESIDVTAGNDTYEPAKYWSEITTLDCSDNAAGSGNVWDDGDLSVTQDVWGVIWDYGSATYKLDCYFTVGNGSTTTHFRTDNENITWASGVTPTTAKPFFTNSSYFYSGNLVEGLGVDGSIFNFYPTANIYITASWNGYQYFYGCRFNIKSSSNFYLNNNNKLTMSDCVLNFETGTSDRFLCGPITILRGIIASTDGGADMDPSGGSPTISYVITNMERIQSGLQAELFFRNLTLTNTTTQELTQFQGRTMNLIDIVPLSPTKITITHADGIIRQKYTVNIHVSDKDGANLETVAVLCEDTDGNTTGGFTSVNTDANGDIAEQEIRYKEWTTTSETLKDYSPHKFTISKAGYETLILDAITIDGPIDWHLELQASKQPPAPWQEGMM